jgi:hypothetical protein
MSHDEQLAWEARAGKPAAAAAFLAALLAIVAGVYLPLALTNNPDGADELLRAADTESGDFVVAGVLQALGLLLVIPVLLYLFRATRYRNPRLMPAAAVLAVLGAVTVAVVTSCWTSLTASSPNMPKVRRTSSRSPRTTSKTSSRRRSKASASAARSHSPSR